ncbi:MAG: ATP synthase F1 subunit delta [Nitrospinae bacterium]|nr:ATP synthase F1 subunit delta [Nitrospinota bacterium]
MIENVVSRRYAEALSESIAEDSRLRAVLKSMETLCGAFRSEPNLTRFFANPAIPLTNKNALLSEMCDRVQADEAVRNLLRILNQRKKILYLSNIASFFEDFVDRRLNQVRVDVVSASPLTPDQAERIKASLSGVLGKGVIVESREDASLIGGMVLSVGSLVVDATIKNRLALLKRSIEK